ncbi:protein of unknown function DUF185 [[Leptolyngbya] sp. PCC 7376]|uniref:class I SAM-dependent methyltransferase n=1 Tax=[Leptolyngbya] sp. PCC 7376 TaxID=111781 RepID=UPI00029EE6AE|nr:SAM-dependent methyltransferase [[Leptolyngbya] sp. PCC 7376]AFY39257.1 protein of unknown function DUF185 [[Leptolyngbya] sp. PCC 7376]
MTSALFLTLQDRIKASKKQAIPFAEYMEIVLYDSQHGYYSGGNVDIGKQGDFFTASSLGSDFGELLAEQIVELHQILDCDPFQIVEVGAGKGELAKDILSYLQSHHLKIFKKIKYIIIEKSPALIQQQQEKLEAFTEEINVTWSDWSAIAPESIQGCVFSNELLDAFPVHRVVVKESQLQEIYVALDPNSETSFTETIEELSQPALTTYFQNLELAITDYPDGFQTEVNLQMFDWLKQVESKLKSGYILTIDYGYPAAKYYHPQRSQGTLQAYFQHRHHSDFYVNLGQQDLTAHVDFTTLQRCGETLGLETLGLTQQGLFLMALGLGDRLNELATNPQDVMTVLRRRDALHQLMDPMGLGKFYVLLQGKTLTEKQLQSTPTGFAHPI